MSGAWRSLENIYCSIFNEKYEAHNARTDTTALLKIMKSINKPLHGVLYPMLSIPWRNVSGIGYHSEQSLLAAGIYDITSLFIVTQGHFHRTKCVLLESGILLTPKLMENIFHWYKLANTLLQYRNEILRNSYPRIPTVEPA